MRPRTERRKSARGPQRPSKRQDFSNPGQSGAFPPVYRIRYLLSIDGPAMETGTMDNVPTHDARDRLPEVAPSRRRFLTRAGVSASLVPALTLITSGKARASGSHKLTGLKAEWLMEETWWLALFSQVRFCFPEHPWSRRVTARSRSHGLPDHRSDGPGGVSPETLRPAPPRGVRVPPVRRPRGAQRPPPSPRLPGRRPPLQAMPTRV